MRESIQEALTRGGVIVCDGAMGTQLQARGLPAGVISEAWNDERPEVIRQVLREYLEAGAQILTANTFGANRLRLRNSALAGRAAELARLGVRLAREVAGNQAWVAGDVGPTGEILEPFGPLSVAEAEEAYAEQAEALSEAGADLILVETQHDLEEASCAVRAAKQHTTLPVFCTFAFNGKGRTMMGLRPELAAQRALELGADAVGTNCGDGPAAILVALREMRGASSLPLIAQSNAGLPQLSAGGQASWDVTAEQMAEYARQYVELGARIIGGCCGTAPSHIAAIAAALRQLPQGERT